MRTRPTALALAALVASAAWAPAFAQPSQEPVPAEAPGSPHGPRHRHGMRGMHPPRVGPVSFMLRQREALALSSEQVDRLERIRLDAARELIRRGADLRITELELRALRRAEPVDLGAVEAKLRDVERLRTELRLARIRAAEDAKAQLTPDQRAKLRALIQEGSRHHRSPRAAPIGA